MKTKPIRIPIPKDIEAEVLFKANHTCSICNNPAFGIQIAHIDDNPSNNAEENLIILCPNDHDRASSKSPLSKAFTVRELKKYKKSWEEIVQKRRNALRDPSSIRLIRFDGADVNTVFLEVENGSLRGFQEPLTFELLGFNWGNVDIYPDSFRDRFKIGDPLKKISDCRKIRLKFQNETFANEVYVIWEDGRKHWIPDFETLREIRKQGGSKDIDGLDYLEFNAIPHGLPLINIFQVRTNRILQTSMSTEVPNEE